MWGCQKKEHDLVEYTLDLVLKLIDPNPLLPFSISHEFHNNAHCGPSGRGVTLGLWVWWKECSSLSLSLIKSLRYEETTLLFVCHHWTKITVILPVSIIIWSDCGAVCSVSSCLVADWGATEKWPHRLMVDRGAPSLRPSWWWHTLTHTHMWPTSLHLPPLISSTEYFIIAPLHTTGLKCSWSWTGWKINMLSCCYSNDPWEQHSYGVDTSRYTQPHRRY